MAQTPDVVALIAITIMLYELVERFKLLHVLPQEEHRNEVDEEKVGAAEIYGMLQIFVLLFDSLPFCDRDGIVNARSHSAVLIHKATHQPRVRIHTLKLIR